MIDIKFLEKLLELLNSSQAGTIEVRKNLWSTTIKVAKDSSPFSQAGGPVTYHVAAGPGSAGPPPSSSLPTPSVTGAGSTEEGPGASGTAAPPELAKAEAPESQLSEIKSPMVGTFYAQPEPGADPYVRTGTRIAPGQTLCIIEAMKIMNPIDAELAGVIEEICVQDAQPVEFGQVLFRVNANA